MKYVINDDYGGFSISEAAAKRYAELKGIEFVPVPYGYGRDIERNDPVLVQVVEELGSAANGSYATLRITDIPSGAQYRLQEYDGAEYIELATEIEWDIAS